ncbi:MAG: ATP-binding protein [Sphingomonadales bacterium]|nr:MAG: ATP-binding protein [Sphingomonadales bacterium]
MAADNAGRVRVSQNRGGDGRVATQGSQDQRPTREGAALTHADASPKGIELTGSADSERVWVEVRDHGPGIPASARELVFERFHSLRPAGEAFGSHSGLGLAIARTIVEAHFGSLTAAPRADGEAGACLIITLPALQTE